MGTKYDKKKQMGEAKKAAFKAEELERAGGIPMTGLNPLGMPESTIGKILNAYLIYRRKIIAAHDNIVKERAIICVCWKWEGEDEVHALTWDKNQDDKTLLKKFIKELNKADEIIGHNGDRFDIKWLRTRCIFHDIDMFPTYRTIDTLKYAKSSFYFNSNKLDYNGIYIMH